jgi:Flp pilus assembly protein protease CpaA
MADLFPMLVVLGAAVAASITDVSRFKVYNLLTFPCFFGGLAYGLWSGSWQGLLMALFGAFLGLTILLIPYLMGGLGAGDVKYVMAIGTWLGPKLLIPAILIGCVATIGYFFLFIGRAQGWRGVLASVQLLALRLSVFGKHFVCADAYESVQEVAQGENPHGRLIPFSAMVSLGIVVSIILGAWMSVG